MDESQTRIGASVRALAAAFEDQQADLAAVLDITQVSVSRKMRGQSKWTLRDVQILARHYEVSVDQVLAGPRAWLGLPPGRDGDTTEYHRDSLAPLAA